MTNIAMTNTFEIFEENQEVVQAEKRKTTEKLLEVGMDIQEIMHITNFTEKEIKEIIEKQGIKIGIQETTLKLLQNLMNNMQLTIAQAMVTLEIPEIDREKYAAILKHNQ